MQFWLGTDRITWLERTDVPLFISRRTLQRQQKFPRAVGPWVMDSGGFTELSLDGRWSLSEKQYADFAVRMASEIGNLAWVAPMDWMCEPAILARTGLTVEEHQRRTVDNLLTLRGLTDEVQWIPVLQGWDPDDYLRHIEAYLKSGILLEDEALVGLGTICRRQNTTRIALLIRMLRMQGLKLHCFGLKTTGLKRAGDAIHSADSMAWSFGARKRQAMEGCTHKRCNHCLRYALSWRDFVLSSIPRLRETPDA